MADGKAKLLRDDYCDGLGNCLPVCPTGAIGFETREAEDFNADAVKANTENADTLACGCPSEHTRLITREDGGGAAHADGSGAIRSAADIAAHPHTPRQAAVHPHTPRQAAVKSNAPHPHTPQQAAAHPHTPQPYGAPQAGPVSRLAQWPAQIRLVPVNAPFFDDARLLIAADCAAYAYYSFHDAFMKDRITLIGCPKLDGEDYSVKLGAILQRHNIKSVMIARMEVPCCGGLEHAVAEAIKNSGKMIPWQVVIISTDGEIISD